MSSGSDCVVCLGIGSVGVEGGATGVVTDGHHCCMQWHASMSASIADEKSRSSSSSVHCSSIDVGDCWVGFVVVGGIVGVSIIVAGIRCCMCLHALAIASSSDG